MNDGLNHTRCSHRLTTSVFNRDDGVNYIWCQICLFNLTLQKPIEELEREIETTRRENSFTTNRRKI